jgi:hypothetical protein
VPPHLASPAVRLTAKGNCLPAPPPAKSILGNLREGQEMRMLTRILMALAVAGLAACSNPDVYNVESAPFNARETATLDDVQRAILFAGAKRDWKMTVVDPGHILATHTRSGHSATVDIRFDTQTYSISYKDSQYLQYDGATVHPTYNRWIQYLQEDIATYVQAI